MGGIGFGYDFFLLKETAGPMCHRLTRDLWPLTDEDFVYLRQESLSLNALAKLKGIRGCPRLRLRPRDRQLPARTARRQVENDLAGDDAGRG